MKKRKLITALLCATMAIAPMNLNVFSVSAEEVSITDIDQIQEMLTVFLEENNLDASVVSNEKYPGYQPVVVEYNMDAEVDARRAIMDYIIETNIDLYNIGLMPMKDGVSAYLIPIDYSVQGTGCIPNDSDDYDDGEKDYVTYACLEAPYSGDVNCDNKISISDAVLLSRYVNEDAITISPLGLANAELNSDKQLTMDDVNLILRKIARLD